jgi:hypothetical protein
VRAATSIQRASASSTRAFFWFASTARIGYAMSLALSAAVATW